MPYSGLAPMAYGFNWDDVASYTLTGNCLTSFTLKTGAKGFRVSDPRQNPHEGTQNEFVQKTTLNKFNKTFGGIVLQSGQDVAEDIIDPMANGKFIFFYQRLHESTGGPTAVEVIGIHRGAHATAMTQVLSNDDNDGGWQFTMVEEDAPMSNVYAKLGTTTQTTATTIAYLESLCEDED